MAADKKIGMVQVTLVRGLMGKKPDHRATVRGAGPASGRMHSVEVAATRRTTRR